MNGGKGNYLCGLFIDYYDKSSSKVCPQSNRTVTHGRGENGVV